MVRDFSSLCPCPEGSKYENQCLVQFFCLSLTPLVINKKQSSATLLNKPLSLASLQRYPVPVDARASAAAPGCRTTTLQRGLMAASTASPTDSSNTRQEPRLLPELAVRWSDTPLLNPAKICLSSHKALTSPDLPSQKGQCIYEAQVKVIDLHGPANWSDQLSADRLFSAFSASRPLPWSLNPVLCTLMQIFVEHLCFPGGQEIRALGLTENYNRQSIKQMVNKFHPKLLQEGKKNTLEYLYLIHTQHLVIVVVSRDKRTDVRPTKTTRNLSPLVLMAAESGP